MTINRRMFFTPFLILSAGLAFTLFLLWVIGSSDGKCYDRLPAFASSAATKSLLVRYADDGTLTEGECLVLDSEYTAAQKKATLNKAIQDATSSK